jgi:uncharacterized protein (DUF488 family)
LTAATVFTVGHGTRSTEALVAVLRSAGVTTVVDVRRHPGSRRHPHLGEAALRRSLPDLGVAYEWWGEALGGRRPRRAPSRHPAWHNPAFQGYADHTDTAEFRDAVERLRQRAGAGGGGERLAVMCAETLWWRCHRRLIADALVVRGTPTTHLIDPATHRPHVLHPALRVGDDGWPVYDVGAPQSML